MAAELMGRRLETEEAAGILDSGGVLVLGTDTLPGLHCRADDPDAVARIFALKGRPATRPLLVLAASTEQADRVSGPLDGFQTACCAQCWPGPFSLILPARPDLPAAVTAGGSTVAVRVPGPEALRNLILLAGHPLVSTSANRTGEAPAADPEAAAALFGGDVDGWWAPPGAGRGAGRASALVDLTVRPPAVLREGPVPWPGGVTGGLDGVSADE